MRAGLQQQQQVLLKGRAQMQLIVLSQEISLAMLALQIYNLGCLRLSRSTMACRSRALHGTSLLIVRSLLSRCRLWCSLSCIDRRRSIKRCDQILRVSKCSWIVVYTLDLLQHRRIKIIWRFTCLVDNRFFEWTERIFNHYIIVWLYVRTARLYFYHSIIEFCSRIYLYPEKKMLTQASHYFSWLYLVH